MGVDFIGRKLGFILLLAAVALPVSAANPASISGFVRDSGGVPQMGHSWRSSAAMGRRRSLRSLMPRVTSPFQIWALDFMT